MKVAKEVETAVELRATSASITTWTTPLMLISCLHCHPDCLDAKAGLTGGNTYTGSQVVRDRIDIKPADSTYFLRLNRNTATQLDILTGNIPSGGNLNIKNSNALTPKWLFILTSSG